MGRMCVTTVRTGVDRGLTSTVAKKMGTVVGVHGSPRMCLSEIADACQNPESNLAVSEHHIQPCRDLLQTVRVSFLSSGFLCSVHVRCPDLVRGFSAPEASLKFSAIVHNCTRGMRQRQTRQRAAASPHHHHHRHFGSGRLGSIHLGAAIPAWGLLKGHVVLTLPPCLLERHVMYLPAQLSREPV